MMTTRRHTTRQPAVAGSFYPASPATLEAMIDKLLSQAASPPTSLATDSVKSLVVPHAGYIYSGSVAAAGYAMLRERPIEHVVILGPTHRVGIRGMALPDADAFETPLGTVMVNQKLAEVASQQPMMVTRADVHAEEHSIEVQLPFVQKVLPNADVLPVAVGGATPREVNALLQAVWGGPETVILISSDLSHYHRWAEAKRRDAVTIRQILNLDGPIRSEQACGAYPLNGMMRAAEEHDLTRYLVTSCNSGDTAGDVRRVVGYATIALQEPTTPKASSD